MLALDRTEKIRAIPRRMPYMAGLGEINGGPDEAQRTKQACGNKGGGGGRDSPRE